MKENDPHDWERLIYSYHLQKMVMTGGWFMDLWQMFIRKSAVSFGHLPFPDAPCMDYLPAFTPKMAQMQVNIPYMEHLGLK